MKILILQIPLVGNKLPSFFSPLALKKVTLNTDEGTAIWDVNELDAKIMEVK